MVVGVVVAAVRRIVAISSIAVVAAMFAVAIRWMLLAEEQHSLHYCSWDKQVAWAVVVVVVVA